MHNICYTSITIYMYMYVLVARYLHVCVLLGGGGRGASKTLIVKLIKISYPMHYTHLVVEGIPVHPDEVHQMTEWDSDPP